MGCGHLLASAEPMEIIVGGKKVEGVFMEAAEGSDLGRLKKDDPLYDINILSVENPEFLQQITDLQVLDFICGNVDRHKENMVYQLKSTEGKAPVFVGVKGIDNDCAFGTPKIVEGKQIMRMVNPDFMQYITPAMAVKVNELKKDMFILALKNNGITEKEIDAAWDRVGKVRDALQKEQIKIIHKKDWKEQKLKDREVNDGTYYDTVKNIRENVKEKVAKQHDKAQNIGHVDKAKPVEYIKDRNNFVDTLISKKDQIMNLRKKMEDAKAIFYDSSEYKLMKKSFEKVEKLTLQIEEKNSQGIKIEEGDIEKLTSAYITLAEKTENYIDLKKLLPHQERGQKRRAFAVELLEFAHDTLDGIGAEFDKEKNTDKDMAAKEEVVEEMEL